MADNPLLCVVTGMEHSGTTYLARSINRLKGVSSGFECGVLLAPSPRQFHRVQPYYRWMSTTPKAGHWGLSQSQLEHCCDTDSFTTFYERVHRLSPVCTGSWLIDKTPRYVFHLERVMGHTDVPVLITHKDIRLLYRSYARRIDSPLARLLLFRLLAFLRRYLAYRRNVQRWRDDPRVMLVEHTRLTRDPEGVMQELCKFLGVDCELDEAETGRFNPIRADYDIEGELAAADQGLAGIERRLLEWVELRA